QLGGIVVGLTGHLLCDEYWIGCRYYRTAFQQTASTACHIPLTHCLAGNAVSLGLALVPDFASCSYSSWSLADSKSRNAYGECGRVCSTAFCSARLCYRYC